MARQRLVAVAVLLLSVLAVASCRALEAEPDAYGDGEPTVVALSDDQAGAADGAAVPQEEAPGSGSGSAAEAATPTVATADVGQGLLIRLPSHRRPCRHGFLHRHFLWARRHGVHPDPAGLASNGDEGRELDQEAELKDFAEPDPDSRRPDADGEQESEAAKAWKGEMVRRFRRHGIRFQFRHGHEEQDEEEEKASLERAAGGGMKRFHQHHHEEEATRKRFFYHGDRDSENEVDDEVEELARRLSRAILRRSFHGRRHHHHHHAEEGGVKKWFKGLVNRF